MEATNRKLILVVDDHATHRTLLANVLGKSGFDVLTASEGTQGLALALQHQPDLILLDIFMPGMNGFDVCLRLKENAESKDIPVILMTDLTEVEHKARGLALGAVDYITKPLQTQEVLSRVELHLRLQFLTLTLTQQNQNLKEEIEARRLVENELHQLTEELEARVKQRTKELSAALERLEFQKKQLLYQASHDTLTGLPNRRWLLQRLKQLRDESTQGICPTPYGILLLDLDHFKKINDSLGHLLGDQFLKKMGLRLQKTLGDIGTITRFGGDKFVVLLEEVSSLAEAERVAQLILRQFEVPFRINGYEILTSASIGIALSTMNCQKSSQILRDADIAMHQVKVTGRGGYQVLTPQMQASAIARWQLERDLRQAVTNQDLYLEYQPIFLLATGQLVGFEALLRWQHPTRGLMSPQEFVPIAEEIGLIQTIDLWGLEVASQQLQQWQKGLQLEFSLFINVNLSVLQLRQTDLLEQVEAICQKTGLPPTALKLEITESCFLESSHREVEMLERFYQQGIRICIDDFGTGYSSLSRLYSLPIHTLKIDQTFVHAIDSNLGGREVVRIIVSLAHSLGMDVVAEGIETKAHLDFLQAIGCDLGQGYFLARPQSAHQITQLLKNQFFPELN